MGLNKLLADTASLTATFNGKKAEIDAATAKQLTDLTAWKGQFLQRAQQNLLQDSGRFFDPSVAGNETKNADILLGGAAFHSKFSLYNGATITEAGKFIQNNSTNGGTGAALGANAKSLTDKMRGVGNSKAGIEFYIAEVSIGQNPSTYPVETDGVTRYLGPVLTSPCPYSTFMIWLQVLEGSVSLSGAGAPYRNGLSVVSSGTTPDDGWVHLAGVTNNPGGYVNPGLNLAPGSRCLIALPAVLAGDIRGFVHTSPILTQKY